MGVARSVGHGLFLAVLTGSALLAQSVDPPAPPGRTSREGAATRLYIPDSMPSVELRLYPAEAGDSDLDRYMSRRMQRGVSGLGGVDFSPPDDLMGIARMAVGMSGGPSPRIVAVIGCERADSTKRYGELLMPPNPDLLQDLMAKAALVIAQSCIGTELAADAPAPEQPVPQAEPVSEAPFSGAPLDEEDIAGVLYSWDQVFEITGLRYVENTYLLLGDGTARDGVPEAAPSEFDVAADRQANPRPWGTWRKRWGGKVEMTFEGDPFEPPGQLWPEPGRSGERLEGRFEKSSSYAIADVASWANWGLTLSADGTFQRWRTSGVGGSSGWGRWGCHRHGRG